MLHKLIATDLRTAITLAEEKHDALLKERSPELESDLEKSLDAIFELVQSKAITDLSKEPDLDIRIHRLLLSIELYLERSASLLGTSNLSLGYTAKQIQKALNLRSLEDLEKDQTEPTIGSIIGKAIEIVEVFGKKY